MFINPGVTPNKYQNPGFAVFEITDDEEQKPVNLKMEFLDISKTFGTNSLSYDELEWLSVSLNDNFGLYDLTPDSLASFRAHLIDDRDYA